MTGGPASTGAVAAPERRLPPVVEGTVASIALVFTGGIYLASYLPDRPPLGPAVGLLIAAGVLLLGNVGMLSRVREFAWDSFFRVCGWTLLAYAVIAGMLEYVFVRNHTRGAPLVLMTLMLVAFTVAVAMLFAFSVARHQPVVRAADDR